MIDRRCPDCGGTMKQGYLLDQGEGAVYASSWIEGPPERSLWFGLKTRGRAKYGVESYRCDKCGFLKSYALKPA